MKKRAAIIGVGSCLPEKTVTNNDLAKTIDTSDEWITTRTGIKERRVTDYETKTSDLAFNAAKNAIENANIPASELDLIIVATTTPDTLFPSTGCILQDRLNAPQSAAFDVSAACSGFNYALSIASAYVESETYKNILVVGADTLTKYVDWKDRSVCVLFGDAAGAVVINAKEDGSGILASCLGTEGAGRNYLIMPGGGSADPEIRKSRYISMDGKEVFKFAVRALEKSIKEVLVKAKIDISQVNLFIPHQANIRIIDHVVKKMGIPQDKVFVNLHKYGNTSAASVPLALDEATKAGKINRGDVVVLAGFGAGLTYGSNIIKF